MNKKIGLCLTGGGAKGAYQIGAVQALDDLGKYKDVAAYSGTSIGAANVAVLASTSIEKTREIWFNMPKDALTLSKPLLERIKNEKFRAFENGIYTMDTFERVMMPYIDSQKLKAKEVYITISESGEEDKGLLQIISSTYKHYIKKDSKVHYLPLQKLDQDTCLDVVKASCSIPIVFPAVVKDNKKYYDGGLFDNMPVLPLVEAGCTEIYIISISFLKQTLNVTKKYPNVLFHMIKPSKSLGRVLDFGEKHSKHIYDMGYNDTIEYFKNLEE